MRRWVAAAVAAAALATAAPALAQVEMVSAARPDSLAEALRAAGHQVTRGTDDTGDPVLELVLGGYKARLLFLDCDPSRHDNCRSVQFLSGFDAEGAGMDPAEALRFAGRYRYAAVTLNAAGDPTLRWDIETGDGIPRAVFVSAAARFLGTIRAMSALLYPAVPAG